ncbi:MAG: helix-turn-helix domain-containing protein, partial [Candidatus Schmidhempelia sp.]|nr:helix-turn-helix domain-containing protein [Candidatus Schmidhempelia sp.]
ATGYAPSTLSNAFAHSWPKAEKIIAEVIGVPPCDIWPSRYNKKRK